jgi:hypothetical protein
MSDKRYLVILLFVILLLISLPYLVGFLADNTDYRFGGFLMNPIDGHSYLAKMQQGFRGEWKFRLPYTADPGEGAYLFLFYILLGHIGRITQIPLIYVFHAARIISAAWLFIMISHLLGAVIRDIRYSRIGLFLAFVGSGLGWIAALFGAFTSDLWVAEIYPFLSAYTNPHFSLGLGIMVWVMLPKNREKIIENLIGGILLGIIQPFGVVIIGLVKIINGALISIKEKIPAKSLIQARWAWALIGFCIAGGSILIYQLFAILTDPILVQWNDQNITMKPSIIDLMISLSPCLVLAGIGARVAWKEDLGKTLVLWSSICLGLVFIPWSLQRRFLTGLFLPLAGLSVYGLQWIRENSALKLNHLVILTVFLAVPTNLIVITSGLQAISLKDQAVFIDQNLSEGLSWISENSDQNALVLTNEENGLYVPSLTGRRVVYGHPFETIQAEKELKWLQDLFNDNQDLQFYYEILDEKGVDYVLLDQSLQGNLEEYLVEHWTLTFQSNHVRIYANE